jgi:hypothetical protein
MIQLIYCSTATGKFSENGLDALLVKARTLNKAKYITGLLIFDDGYFLQILEGPRENIEELIGRITTDPRHTDLRVISSQSIREREFGEWSMAFSKISKSHGNKVGYVAYDREMVEFSINASKAMNILYLFQEGVLRPVADSSSESSSVTVTIASMGQMMTRPVSVDSRHTYLIELARAIALSMPDIPVTTTIDTQMPIRFNLRRKMECGEIELF